MHDPWKLGSGARNKGTNPPPFPFCPRGTSRRAREVGMNGLIYLVGLIVVIMAILSFLGLR